MVQQPALSKSWRLSKEVPTARFFSAHFILIMSLFTARDWWCSPPAQDTDEGYDVGSLAVGNFDNVVGADDVVITGSLGGVSSTHTKTCCTRQAVWGQGAIIIHFCIAHPNPLFYLTPLLKNI